MGNSTILLIFYAVLAACAIIGLIFNAFTTLKNTQTNSAKMLFDYVEPILKESQDVLDVLRDREKDNRLKFDDEKLVVFLNQIEIVINFTNKKIFNRKHVEYHLKSTLRRMNNDVEIYNFILNYRKEKKNERLFEDVLSFMRKFS